MGNNRIMRYRVATVEKAWNYVGDSIKTLVIDNVMSNDNSTAYRGDGLCVYRTRNKLGILTSTGMTIVTIKPNAKIDRLDNEPIAVKAHERAKTTYKRSKSASVKNKTIAQRMALNMVDRVDVLKCARARAEKSGKMRELLKAEIALQSAQCELDKHINDAPLLNLQSDKMYQIISRTVYAQLRLLERGRFKTTGENRFADPDGTGAKVLRDLHRGDRDVFDDLVSSTYQLAWKLKRQGMIITGKIELDDGRTIEAILPYDKSLECAKAVKSILGNVQKELYQSKIKHTRHAYDVKYDEKGVEIDPVLHTMAQRAYYMSVSSIDADDILSRLRAKLTDREKFILRLLLETKQVERKYSLPRNGGTGKRWETRKLTIADIARITGIHPTQVERIKMRIREAFREQCDTEN